MQVLRPESSGRIHFIYYTNRTHRSLNRFTLRIYTYIYLYTKEKTQKIDKINYHPNKTPPIDSKTRSSTPSYCKKNNHAERLSLRKTLGMISKHLIQNERAVVVAATFNLRRRNRCPCRGCRCPLHPRRPHQFCSSAAKPCRLAAPL